MKLRFGFVSNSSSSSFLIVGASCSYRSSDRRGNQLAVADKVSLEDGFGGEYNGKSLVFLGGEFDWDTEDAEVMRDSYEPYYVGIYAEEALKAGKTVLELKKEFIEAAKKLGVTYTENEVDLHYGEVSSE
jgi:hypothetical protein